MTTLTTWNSSFLVNANIAGDPSDIQLQALADGSFAAVWGEDSQVFMRVFNADGTPRTGEIKIAFADNVAGKYMPIITALSNGNFIVAWEDGSQSGGDQDSGLWGQIFNPDGVKIGSDIHINGLLPYTQAEVAITALSNGGFAVAYLDYPYDSENGTVADEDSSDVVTRIFNAAGEPVSSDIAVNTTRAGGQTDPAIIALKNGGYAIFFVDGSQSEQLIRGRYFSANGTPLGSDFIVSDSPGGQSNPVATTLADGKFVVVWETNSYDIHAQMFNADGTALGGEFVVNRAATSGDQVDPTVVALKDGGFAISYTSFGAELGSHVVMFRGSGEFAGDFLIEPAPGTEFAEGTETRIAALADGRLVVSWVATLKEEDNRDYYAQIFDPRTGAVSLQGTGTNDHFLGTAFDDVLDGGSGVDRLEGGAGNDTYYVDDARDAVMETSSVGGLDTVITSASYTLSAFVENLIASGSGSLSLIGNDLNNRIIGNAGANVIDGGAGADVMQGGAGNDTYHVDNPGDIIGDESGIDTVVTAISYALGGDLENLTASGGGSINLTGNGAGNVIVGNSGDNILSGGYGNDVLTGGSGRDLFVFSAKLGTYKTDRKANFDTITDFHVPTDSIRLDNAIFKKLGKKGSVSKPAKLNKKFFSLEKAKDKDDHLIYSKKTGILSYDADGSGSKKAIEIAKLDKKLKMTYKDFFII